jgi:hypothetical protein
LSACSERPGDVRIGAESLEPEHEPAGPSPCPWVVTFLKADRATATAVMARPPPYQASSCSVMSSIPAATRSAAPARLASWRLSMSLRGRSKRSYRERARSAAGQSVRRANLPTGSSMRYQSQSLSEWCRASRSVLGAARCPGRHDPAAVSAAGYCRPPPQRRRVGSSITPRGFVRSCGGARQARPDPHVGACFLCELGSTALRGALACAAARRAVGACRPINPLRRR